MEGKRHYNAVSSSLTIYWLSMENIYSLLCFLYAIVQARFMVGRTLATSFFYGAEVAHIGPAAICGVFRQQRQRLHLLTEAQQTGLRISVGVFTVATGVTALVWISWLVWAVRTRKMAQRGEARRMTVTVNVEAGVQVSVLGGSPQQNVYAEILSMHPPSYEEVTKARNEAC